MFIVLGVVVVIAVAAHLAGSAWRRGREAPVSVIAALPLGFLIAGVVNLVALAIAQSLGEARPAWAVLAVVPGYTFFRAVRSR